MRGPVHGGPADGLRVALTGTRRWIDPVTGRGYVAPAPGRALYLLDRRAWWFAGFVVWICSDCAALILERRDNCPLCGRERVSDGG